MSNQIDDLLNACDKNPCRWKWVEWKENDLLSDGFPDSSKWVQLALPFEGGKGLVNFLGKFFVIHENRAKALLYEYTEFGGFKQESRIDLLAEISKKEIFQLIKQDLSNL
jgi:hypothetical protein